MSQRYKTLIGSVLVLLALGSVYTWSLFNLPLSQKFGSDINSVAFTFGLMSMSLAIGASVSGVLKVKLGIKNVIILAAALSSLGLGIAAFAPNIWWLYLSAGVLLGFGDGIGYMLALTNCVRFFPNNKGLISAISIGAYGGGSLLFKAIDSYLLVNYSLEQSLLAWAVLVGAITAIGSTLIYDSIHSLHTNNDTKKITQVEYELFEAIKLKEYWILTAMFVIDCMCGLYIIGVTSDIGRTLINLEYQDAAAAISVAALSNIAGRLVIGALADKLPRIRLITFDQILSLLALLILLFGPQDKYMFYIAIGMVAFSFGGTVTVYPTIISDFFGLKNFAKNYGLLYTGFGIGSLLGFGISSVFGGFNITFSVICVLLVIAIILSFMVRLPNEQDMRKAKKERRMRREKELKEQQEQAKLEQEAIKKALENLHAMQQNNVKENLTKEDSLSKESK